MPDADESRLPAGRTRPPRFGLRGRLVLSFGLSCAVIVTLLETVEMLGLPALGVPGRLQRRIAEAGKHIDLIADLKQERLTRVLKERQDDLRYFSRSDLIVSELRRAVEYLHPQSAGPDSPEALQKQLEQVEPHRLLTQSLQAVCGTHTEYLAMRYVEWPTGRVVLSADRAEVGRPWPIDPLFTQAMQTGEIVVSDLEPREQPAGDAPRLMMRLCSRVDGNSQGAPAATAPMTGRDSTAPAVGMLLEVDANDLLLPILHTGEGLGDTGEAVLLNSAGQILNQLRHRAKDGRWVPPWSRGLGEVVTADDPLPAEGPFEATDYRGQQVLGVLRQIALPSGRTWTMMVKRDRSEVLRPLSRDALRIAGIGAVGIGALIVLSIVIAQHVTRPILAMSRAAGEIAAGRIPAPLTAVSRDEVGGLAAAFNIMADEVRRSRENLEHQVAARTRMLQVTNQRLLDEIDDRIRREAELRESQATLQAVFEAAPIGIGMASRRIMKFFNPHMCVITGYTPEELTGQSSRMLYLTQEEFERIGRTHYEEVRRQGVVAAETQWRRKDGTILDIILRSSTVVPDNPMEGLIFTASDITERKQFERELQAHRDRLEELVEQRTHDLRAVNQELESFSYSVSHDLRAPLRAMDGFSQALLEDCAEQLGEQGRHYAERIRKASQRMGQLIDDLLKLSRVTRLDMVRERVDLTALGREILSELAEGSPGRRVDWRVADGMEARGDARLLRQLLENLLSNAWKFTGRKPDCTIEFDRLADASDEPAPAVFFVRDNGAGYDMTYADKLFKTFQRLHSTNEFEGTGIGLAICQRVVHRHGGAIWSESAVDHGATFYFSLPV